jgi:CubicO group peptidase (beta-lactamase class C family)
VRSSLLDFRDRHGVPAVGAAIVDAHGNVAVDVVGTTRRGGSDAVTVDDAWHIGSCGKSMTAALYARLVERGDAQWCAPLGDLFGDVAVHASWNSVTIDDVLVHRGGVQANPSRVELLASLRDQRSLREQRTSAVAGALSRPPARPGRFRYSNLGYIVAGAAIERITGLAFEEAMTVHVLEPLGITTAGFGPPGRILGHGGRAAIMVRHGLVVGRGRPADPSDVGSDNPPVMTPAGRLHLALTDWAKFQQVFLAGGTSFLAAESVQRLLTVATGRSPSQAMGWAPAELSGVLVGQLGSNSYWMATALIDSARSRTVMVVCNDGRTRLMKRIALFGAEMLAVPLDRAYL